MPWQCRFAHAAYPAGMRSNPAGRPRARGGFSVLELLTVLAVLALLMAIALPRMRAIADRSAVRNAGRDARMAFSFAQRRAVALGLHVAVWIDTTAQTMVVGDAGGSMLTRALGAAYGVSLASTRDSMAYTPLGLAWGAANLTLVVRRGDAADTVSISRVGRVK